ncbi:MAG: hypothetical protein IPM39_17485 [Chloroflexi bacterium]|nr:hypothetical protein [Chloroflexota bacterium]
MASTTTNQFKHTAANPYLWATLLFAAFFAALFYINKPPDGDWEWTFYRAGQNALHVYRGHEIHYVYPPWLAVILAPFALFPSAIAAALWRAATVMMVSFAVWRFGGDIKSLAFTFCTPFFYALMVYGQIDALILLGVALALYSSLGLQLIGCLLILIKPQVAGLTLPIIWLRSDHKTGLLLSGLLVVLLSLVLWGIWPSDVYAMMATLSTRRSIDVWPYGLLLGIPLFVLAWRRRSVETAMLATFFCTPYANLQSLVPISAVLFAKLSAKVSFILLIGIWLVLIATASM